MSKTATLKGKISLDDSEFHKGLRRAADRAKKFGSEVAGAVGDKTKKGLIGLGIAAAGAGTGLLAAAKAAADLGGQLSDASAITGISADKMLVLQQAFANAGMSGEGAAGVIAKLQAAIGRAGMMSEETEEEVSALNDRLTELQALKGSGLDAKEQAKVAKEIKKTTDEIADLEGEAKGVQKAFQMLNLSQSALRNMDGADQLEAVFEALGRITNQSDKMAVLRMLRLPPDLMVLAKDANAFKGARDMLGSLVPIMGQFASEFDRVSDIIGAKPGILFNQLGAGFLTAIVDNPTLQKALSYLETLDFAPIGAAIGDRVSGLVDFITATIQSGNISETVSGVLQTGFAVAVEYLLLGMGVVMATVGGVLSSVFSDNGLMFISGFGAALTGVLIIAAFNFGKLMLAAFYTLEAKFMNSGVGKALSGARAATGVVGMITSAVPSLFSEGASKMQKESAAMVYGGVTDMIYGKDPADVSMRQQRALNDQNIDALGMTQSELLETMTQQVGVSMDGLVGVLTELPSEVKKAYGNLGVDEMLKPASKNARSTARQFMQTLNPDQQKAVQEILNGGPGLNKLKPARPKIEWKFSSQSNNQNQRTTASKNMQGLDSKQQKAVQKNFNEGRGVNELPTDKGPRDRREIQGLNGPPYQSRPKADWTFPNQSNNQIRGGDTKEVTILEKVASLLERNLTAMQVA